MKDHKELMDDPNKKVGESQTPLTKLWRTILQTPGIDADVWNQRLTRFLKSHYSKCSKTPKDIGQERNNFNRAVSSAAITWRSFQKAIQILGPTHYNLKIELTWKNGRTTAYETGQLRNSWADLDLLSPPPTTLDLSDLERAISDDLSDLDEAE